MCFVNYFRWTSSGKAAGDDQGANPEALGRLRQTRPAHPVCSEEGEAAGHPLASSSPVFDYPLMRASVYETLIQASEKVPGPVAFFSYSFFIPYILVGQSLSSEHFARKVFSSSEHFHLEAAVWLGIKIPGPYSPALSAL